MGSIRLLLAIAVVFTHSYGFMFFGGRTAVQLFYMASGFLISFIICWNKELSFQEKLLSQSIAALVSNLFNRSATSLLTFFVFHQLGFQVEFFDTLTQIPADAKWALVLSNIFLIGQDWIMFTGVDDGVFKFMSNFSESDPQLWKGLLVPQAWTLGVEISFYLIAPIILHKRKIILLLLGLSIGLWLWLFSVGLGGQDPWTYRFLPTELALFLLGALSHQLIRGNKILQERKLIQRCATPVTVFIFIYCASLSLLPLLALMSLGLIGAFLLSLPFLFEFQNNHKWDRKVGDLSYPVYISYLLVIWPFTNFISEDNIKGNLPLALLFVAITLIISWSLNRLVESPIKKIRTKVRARSS